MTDLHAPVATAVKRLLDPEPALVDRLVTYVEVLRKWNRLTNLTGFRDLDSILLHGLIDSLSPLPLLPPDGPCADIGSGAGFPGLILAAAQPDRPWTLLEPRRKRASFLREAARQMALNHVRILQKRLEQTDLVVPTITSRAVGGISGEVPSHLEPGGAWILAAGPDDAEEIRASGGFPGLQVEGEVGSAAGGSWLRLKRG